MEQKWFKVSLEFWGRNKNVEGWFYWKNRRIVSDPSLEHLLLVLEEDYLEVKNLKVTSTEPYDFHEVRIGNVH